MAPNTLEVKRGDQVIFSTTLAQDEQVSLAREDRKVKEEDEEDVERAIATVLSISSPETEKTWEPQTNFESQRRNMRAADPTVATETGTTTEALPADRELQGTQEGDEGSEPPADEGSDEEPPPEPTKEELLERARELEIEGRSGMNKEELAEAVAAAEEKDQEPPAEENGQEA
jgi:hypothetical protein